MILSQQDIAAIQDRHARRASRKLRQAFAGEGPLAEPRGRYFDHFFPVADSLIGMSDQDHLVLLELGWLQGLALDQSPQFQEAQRRGKWYGRRLWLQDQLDRLNEPEQ